MFGNIVQLSYLRTFLKRKMLKVVSLLPDNSKYLSQVYDSNDSTPRISKLIDLTTIPNRRSARLECGCGASGTVHTLG